MLEKISYQKRPKAGLKEPQMTNSQKGESHRKAFLFKFIVIGLTLLLILSIPLAVVLGPVPIHYETVWRIVFSQLPLLSDWVTVEWTQAEQNIIWEIRLPRVLLGAIVGAGLATVGVNQLGNRIQNKMKN